MPRGGKRPGAGAPRGNLNAVKSGRYSQRLRAIARGLGTVPEVRDFLLDFQRRQRREERKAALLAHRALLEFVASVPDANNPIVAYLRHAIANWEIDTTFLKQSVSKEDNQTANPELTPLSGGR